MSASVANSMRQLKTHAQNRSAQASTWISIALCCMLLVFVTGCASYGIVQNKPLYDADIASPYSLKTWSNSKKAEDFIFILAFSGGGTRAAAKAYGVMQELRDTLIDMDGRQERLLDRVTHISSVSGGSFTAAYYGLYGDKMFDAFETEFLRKDVEGALTRSLFRPSHGFTRKGRTERAIDYYNEILFHDATFADMMQPNRLQSCRRAKAAGVHPASCKRSEISMPPKLCIQ